MAGNLKIFNWQMNMGASAKVQHNRTKTQFGDGYAQLVSHGINNKVSNWSGAKNGDLATEIKPIMAFLDEHKGIIPFWWTNPHGQTQKYTCQNYNVSQRKGNMWQITLEFEEYF